MALKFLFFYVIFFINFNSIVGQNDALSCNYGITDYGYSCYLTMINPKGLNNFVSIGGTHMSGYNDNSVLAVLTSSGTSTNIPSIICSKFRNTKRIELTGFTIQQISDYSFSSCTLITILDLHSNSIGSINERAFINNRELQYIYLYYNNIPTLPENVFANQQKLLLIWFDGNRITDLPPNVFRPLTQLQELGLQVNRISTLRPEWFDTLQNLRVLLLHYNQLTSLPRNIFSRLTNMYWLNLFANSLRTIHADSFGFLPNLQTLRLNVNQINAIDENILSYTGISYIQMASNVCANRAITDYSISRDVMRTELRTCFNNYVSQMSACRLTSPFMIGSDATNDELLERNIKLEAKIKMMKDKDDLWTEERKKFLKEIDSLTKSEK